MKAITINMYTKSVWRKFLESWPRKNSSHVTLFQKLSLVIGNVIIQECFV